MSKSKYLIIGGSSGIGFELSTQLATAGNDVIATFCHNKPTTDYGNIQFSHLDVLADQLSFDWLPEQLDGVVYCPGAIRLLPFERITEQHFLDDYKLQVIGAIRVLQQVIPLLKKSTHGSVLLFSTIAVQNGFPYHAQVSASKGAIEGLTKALAAEYAPLIRVNCIAPSLTDTGLASFLLNTEQKKEANAKRHPMKRIGNTKDIAAMAAFLLSEQAGWITGQILHVDGGLSSLKTS